MGLRMRRIQLRALSFALLHVQRLPWYPIWDIMTALNPPFLQSF